MASSGERRGYPKMNHERKEDEESYCHAMQLTFSSVLCMSMQSANKLGVFNIMAKAGPGAKLSSKDIAAQIGTKNTEAPAMLDRILRLLSSHSILSCSVVSNANKDGSDFQWLYSLTPVSKHFVTNEDGVSLAPLMALVQNKAYIDSWSQLEEAVVKGGVPFDIVHGVHTFEYPGVNPEFNQVLNTAMLDHTTMVMKKILDLYKGFEHLSKLVDVGGGLGVALGLITSRYPHIKGINFDLPHVIESAPSYPGVEHIGGDMFEDVPSGDAIFMKWILHDWSDEHCLKLLRNCYKAVPDNGKLIVVEAHLSVMPETSNAVKTTSQIDVLMMTQTRGGKERSQQEFLALAIAAGFSGIRYECLVCNFWIMEFFK